MIVLIALCGVELAALGLALYFAWIMRKDASKAERENRQMKVERQELAYKVHRLERDLQLRGETAKKSIETLKTECRKLTYERNALSAEKKNLLEQIRIVELNANVLLRYGKALKARLQDAETALELTCMEAREDTV